MIHKRKVQKIANSTYSISLPKKWIEKNKIKQKDYLSIKENNDLTLLISHEIKENKIILEKEIDIKNYKNRGVSSLLITLYYLGYNKIILTSNPIKTISRIEIINTLKVLNGFEITSETEKKIILKQLLSEREININQLINILYSTVDILIFKLISGFKIDSILLRKKELLRLYLLIARALNQALNDNNKRLSLKINNMNNILLLSSLAKRLKNIGDETISLCSYLKKKKMKKLEENQMMKNLQKKLKMIITNLIIKKEDMSSNLYNKSSDELIKNIEDERIILFIKNMRKQIKIIEEEVFSILISHELS